MSITFRKAIASDTEILVGFMRGLYLYDHSHFDEAGCRKALSLLIGNEAFGNRLLQNCRSCSLDLVLNFTDAMPLLTSYLYPKPIGNKG